MSMIAGAYLFLPNEFTHYDSSVIDQSLRQVCDNVKDTRKGRYWEAYNSEREVSFQVLVKPTVECLSDCEKELFDLKLLPDDVPEVITITTVLGTDVDLQTCVELTQLLTEKMGCKTLGAKLMS